MFYTPWCILSSVISTIICGVWIDKSAPYFPIEISRTATGPISKWVFSIGLTISVLCLLAETKDTKRYIIIIIGILVLAWVDDVTSHVIHMLGVLLVGLGSFYAVPLEKTWVVLFCATALFVFRLGMKCMAVIFIEKTTKGIFDFQGMKQMCMDIMYTGKTQSVLTLRLFQAAGIMQWIILWLIYETVTL